MATIPDVACEQRGWQVVATYADPGISVGKGERSDVNLATHLLHDAHMRRFEVAVIVSNDSDLLEPIRIVREQLGKTVGILNPHPRPSRALLPHIDFIKQIRPGVLRAAQFPPILRDKHGTFTKPKDW
jgi:NYN domain